jgi:hypothetical protein
VGNTGSGVQGHLLSDGYTGSGLGGLLYLKLGSGHRDRGQGDLHENILGLRSGHPYSEGGISLVRS